MTFLVEVSGHNSSLFSLFSDLRRHCIDSAEWDLTLHHDGSSMDMSHVSRILLLDLTCERGVSGRLISSMKTIGVPYSLVGSLNFITRDGEVSTTEVSSGVVVQANTRIFRDILFHRIFTLQK
jgi:hypothetical protein